mgnify:CR=1 FL=1
MSRYYKRRDEKLYKPPGSLIYIGEETDDIVEISIYCYDSNNYEQVKVDSIVELGEVLTRNYKVLWVHVNGTNNGSVIKQIGDIFNINHLVLEDIMNTDKRPKVNFYTEYTYTIFKNINFDKSEGILSRQISIIKGNYYLITFQEKGTEVFSTIVDRIQNNDDRIRSRKVNFLFYSLIGYLIDNYFYCMEHVTEQIEKLDNQVLLVYSDIQLSDLRDYKYIISRLRRILWPIRELIKDIIQHTPVDDEKSEELNHYYRDIYEHVIELIEILEILQGTVEEVQNLYHTKISHHMNRVMGLLTIVSIIFLPLTLLAGIYGMNFKYMPELNIRWGYPAVLVIMVIIAISLILYFKNKDWF